MATSICAHCVSGRALPGEPTGVFHEGPYFHPAPTSESATDSSAPKRAVVLLTDAFGLPFKNCKLLADKYSERLGCDVWIPDIFNGVFITQLAQTAVMDSLSYMHVFTGRPPIPAGTIYDDLPQTPGATIPLTTKLRMLWTMLMSLPARFANRAAVLDARVETVSRNTCPRMKCYLLSLALSLSRRLKMRNNTRKLELLGRSLQFTNLKKV